jgi:iron complex outermembrane receptor protein
MRVLNMPDSAPGAGKSRRLRLSRAGLLLTLLAGVCLAQQKAADLTQLSLEDLLNVQVTTASKKEQKLAQIPAAVCVITADDIARSGLTSIPEVLRLAPGVDVAQISSSVWAIAIRGFNSRYSNKLLVLVDGRTVYSATFSQVLWNVQDLPLDDVERIEVIRGPGAVLWGANAVDGVINIITRNANDTQGGLLSVTGGSHDSALASLRYGWHTGPNAAFRFSTQYVDRSPVATPSGASDNDRWDLQRADFRGDWSPSQRNGFMFEGNLDQSHAWETNEQAVLGPALVEITNGPSVYSGGDMLFRWKHELEGGSETTLQAFYDRNHEQYPTIGTTDDTFDLDFQHHLHLLKRHDVVWGGEARVVREQTRGTFSLGFDPPNTTINLFSGFVSDEATLFNDRLRVTVGSKFERSAYSGLAVQPDIRLLWAPRPRHTLWMAVSCAVRSPARLEEGAHANGLAVPGPGGLPLLAVVVANPNFDSEKLIAYEAGYRVQATRRVSLDLATFYNHYTELSSGEPQNPILQGGDTATPYLELPVELGNKSRAHSTGVEITGHYRVRPFWDLSGSYSFLHLRYQHAPGATVGVESFDAGASPENQFQLHSYFSLLRHLSLNNSLYRVGRLLENSQIPIFAERPLVPSYTRLDLDLAWRLKENLQASAGLQNLLDPRHLEFGEDITPMVPAEVRRSYYGKLVWRF